MLETLIRVINVITDIWDDPDMRRTKYKLAWALIKRTYRASFRIQKSGEFLRWVVKFPGQAEEIRYLPHVSSKRNQYVLQVLILAPIAAMMIINSCYVIAFHQIGDVGYAAIAFAVLYYCGAIIAMRAVGLWKALCA